MEKYHIDTSDGTVELKDRAGAEYRSLDDACTEARRAVHDMARDHVTRGGNRRLTASIRDRNGKVVYSVSIILSESFARDQ